MSTTHRTSLALAALLLSLAACGGGRDDERPAAGTDTSTPGSSATSMEAFVRWVRSVGASETQEPVATSQAAPPPASETVEPIDVD
jgi:ABC-type glycerol-3-phosphate transport system substrate-binding protein